jgi:hypothetical protein
MQCDWATPHGSDGFLCCTRDAGHDPSVEAHCTIYEHPDHGAYEAYTPGEDTRLWIPGWFWKAILAQDHTRPRRGYRDRAS